VYRWTGSTWQEIGSVGRDVTSFSATGLSPGTRHHFKVRAFNADAAVDTDTVSAMTPDSPVGLIGTLTAAPKSGKRIDLTWSNAANADGYRVYIRGSNGVWERLATLGPNTAAYSVRSGLEKNTEYRFRVEAFNRTQVVNSEIMAKTLDWDHRWLPGIYVIAHKAALEIGVNPFYHSALLIVADSIDGIENISNNNVDEALKEKGWVTLGAQPQTFFPPFGKLIKQQDFPGDHPSNNLFPTPLLTSLGGRSLTTVIDNLLAADNRYNNNLDYDAVPGVRDVWSLFDGYNSNSYVSGLLRKVGLSPPLLPVEAHRIPGYYGVPVPASHFD